MSTPTLVRDGIVSLWHGDALEVLRVMPDASVHAVITDPPYGLADLPAKKVAQALAAWVSGDRKFIPSSGKGMAGQAWDRFVPPPALWDEVLRVLVPGGWLACFAAPRTVDLMGMSIRLAGFEMRDQILAWVCGTNMAKVTDSGTALERAGAAADDVEAWRGWAPALKPAQEPVLLARKPLDGTLLHNLRTHGAGSLHIDATRVPFASAADEAESKGKNQHATTTGGRTYGEGTTYGDATMLVRADYDAPGRFPTDLLICHLPGCRQTGEVTTLRGDSRAGTPREKGTRAGGFLALNRGAGSSGGPGGVLRGDETVPSWDCQDQCPAAALGDKGRFFPTFHYAGRAHVTERPVVDGVQHVTVKPLSVIEWLFDLLAVPGMRVLDPFAGSGTAGEIGASKGIETVLVESHQPYIPLIEQRLDRAAA